MFEQRISMVESLLKDTVLFPVPLSGITVDADRVDYLLKSLWVMTCAEFEGSIENLVEKHLEKVLEKPMKQINHAILMRSFYENQQKVEYRELVYLFKRGKKVLREEIKKRPFTGDFDAPSPDAIEKMFLHLGVHFEKDQLARLAFLKSFCDRRHLIAHGQSVSITTGELLDNIESMKIAYRLLKRKLSRNSS